VFWGLSEGTAYEVSDQSAGTGLGGESEPLPAAADVLFECWLDDLEESGNGLLESCGRIDLRAAFKGWFASRSSHVCFDGLADRCAPDDVRAAALLLRRRVSAVPPRDTGGQQAKNGLLTFASSMLSACEERPSAGDEESQASVRPSAALAEAAVAIQSASSAGGVVRAAMDAALRLFRAKSAIWWEQQPGPVLAATSARGVRPAAHARTLRVDADFWQAREGAAPAVLQLSPERPEHAAVLESLGATSAFFARARSGRRWIGALSVQDGEFEPEQADLLAALVQQVAAALRALSLAADKRQLTDAQHRSTSELGVALGSALSLDELLELICRSTRELVRADTSLLYLAASGGELELRASAGEPVADDPRVAAALRGLAEEARTQPLGNAVWRTGNGGRSPGAAVRKADILSVLGLALTIRGDAVGALVLLDRKPNAFTSTQRQMMAAYAVQAAVAVENLQLVDDMQRRLLEMADLTWVSTRISSTLDVERIAATMADAAAKALDVPRAALFLADEEGRCSPIPKGCQGMPGPERGPLPAGAHLGSEALATGVPQAVTDAEREGYAEDPLVNWMGVRSLLCIPMVAQQGLRGLLVMGDENARTFPSHTLALLSAYANQTALALQSASLYEDVVRHLSQLSNLFAVSQTLASSLELTQTLERVLDSAAELLDAPVCSVMLVDPESKELVIKAARGLRPDHALATPLKPGEGLAGRAAQSGVPLASADIRRDGRFKHRVSARQRGLHAAICAPLIARGRTVGVLNLYRRSSSKFTEDNKDLVMSLANSAAVAIENARLYEEAQERAQFLTAMMGEINHRMRNTLQAVAGLLRMELESPRARSKADALRRGIARLQSVAVVHDMTRASKLEFVDVKQAARQIVQLSCQTVAPEKRIETRVSGARVMLPSQQATSVAMILSELVDNALRHGLAGVAQGCISVNLAEGGGDVVIEVKDNGVGLPKGFDLESKSGLGLKVVKGLVEEDLGGTLELDTRKALTVRARFPKHG